MPTPIKHARQQIREEIAALLGGLTTTGTRVYTNRTNPLSEDEGELPGWCIGADPQDPSDEPVQARSFGSQVTGANVSTQRTYRFPLRGYAKMNGTIEDTLDTMAAEAEIALFADPLLGVAPNNLASEMRIMGTNIQLAGDGDLPVGKVTMMIEVDYWCMQGAPQTIVN